MDDTNKGDQNSSNSDGGGATGDNKTPQSEAELKTAYENQKVRAEKAEAALKAKEDAEKAAADEAKKKAEADAAAKNNNQNSGQADPIEVARIAKVFSDLDDQQTEQLLKVAKATGLSPAEAKKDPLFSAWNNQYQETQKKERAKMGASQGSGQGGSDEGEPITKPGMKRDEHMEAWKKALGRK
jgi:hypothetical protein